MPVTEQTCYNMRRLHKVFAVSSILLTLATFWMLTRDHLREWKTIQRTSDRIETRLTKWQQLQTLTDDVVSERERLQQALSELLSKPFSETTLDVFRGAVRADAKRREAAAPSFERLDRTLLDLDEVAAAALAARNIWRELRLEADKARLQAEDAAVRAGSAEGDETAELEETSRELAAASRQTQTEWEQAAAEMRNAERAVVPARESVLRELDSWVTEARFREDQWARVLRTERARLDVEKARLGLSVRDQTSDAELKQLQDAIERRKQRVGEVTRAAETAAAHRERLRSLRAKLTEAEVAVRKRLDENDAEARRLEQLLAEKNSTYFNFWGIVPLPGKKWLELPILDAFNSPRKIENLWSEGLDRPAGSFGRVPRFDRCTTCHQGMRKALADSAARPALCKSITLDFALPLPETTMRQQGKSEATNASQLKSMFGLALAAEGLLDPEDVTIRFVDPTGLGTSARKWSDVGKTMRAGDIRAQLPHADQDAVGGHASTGLLVGDIIVSVDGTRVPAGGAARQWVIDRMVNAARADSDRSKRPLRVSVRRGLPHPYAGHPRLDLFVAETSPHKMAEFACTVCHEGQGSATSFKWASHAPNDSESRRRWRRQYGWFDNGHWIYPMVPRRFVESSCLKCHHDVVELERSERFPHAPAPKLATGYRLIRTLGCFGCHEIQGSSSPRRRIGPDLRLEPNYHAAALQFKGASGTGYEALTLTERATVDRLIQNPEDESLRQAVHIMLLDDARKAADSARAATLAVAEQGSSPATDRGADEPRFSEYVHRTLLPLLQQQEMPGKLRKVGPSLRFVSHKLDVAFLGDWIRRPRHFRPSTRMPQTFGLWKHLPGEQLRARKAVLLKEMAGEDGDRPAGRIRSAARIGADLEAVDAELRRVDEMEKRFEPIAIFSMVQYLRQRGQAYEYVAAPADITPIVNDEDRQARIERGKVAFQELGCLACHDHVDFPEIAKYRDPDFVVAGPDLSDSAVKFAAARNPNGPRWLSSWITQPTRYNSRTMMPDLMVQPVKHRDVDENVTSVTDPVADIVAYLLSGPLGDWQPHDEVLGQLDEQGEKVLQELALTYLKDMFPEATARRYSRQGIPYSPRGQLRGAERELVVTPAEQGSLDAERMIQKRLSYVARKSFTVGGCFACHDIPGMEDAKPIGPGLNDWGRKDTALLAFGHVAQYVRGIRASQGAARGGEYLGDAALESESITSSAYFLQQLEAHSRIGFINQKLTEPRSFDYYEARNKRYTERLQMPRFSLDASEREAIMTFVLGLVADPPNPKYVFAPDANTKALLDGTEVLTKYSCRGCHMLETEKWQLSFAPDQYGERAAAAAYPFIPAQFSQARVELSRGVDGRGLRHAHVAGMPTLSDDGLPLILDDEEFPIEEEEDEPFELDRLIYSFGLWRPALVDGYPYQVGDGALDVLAENLTMRRRSYGGALTQYLLPRVVEREKKENPNAKGAEAWAWLPPTLAGEGLKVQPQWLHNYLLQPHRIRPAVIMRMPRYNMSFQEATQLVDYFAARDRTEYPYNLEPVRQPEHLTAADQQYARTLEQLAGEGKLALTGSSRGRHLADAMQMVTDSNYCVRCHLIGDYDPPGIQRVKAPDLAAVHQRLRSDYLRKWLAKPTSIQPYTPMPVNIPYDPTAPLLGTTVPQDLYHGTSLRQLDALVDLLMNFDRYLQQRSPVTSDVERASAR